MEQTPEPTPEPTDESQTPPAATPPNRAGRLEALAEELKLPYLVSVAEELERQKAIPTKKVARKRATKAKPIQENPEAPVIKPKRARKSAPPKKSLPKPRVEEEDDEAPNIGTVNLPESEFDHIPRVLFESEPKDETLKMGMILLISGFFITLAVLLTYRSMNPPSEEKAKPIAPETPIEVLEFPKPDAPKVEPPPKPAPITRQTREITGEPKNPLPTSPAQFLVAEAETINKHLAEGNPARAFVLVKLSNEPGVTTNIALETSKADLVHAIKEGSHPRSVTLTISGISPTDQSRHKKARDAAAKAFGIDQKLFFEIQEYQERQTGLQWLLEEKPVEESPEEKPASDTNNQPETKPQP